MFLFLIAVPKVSAQELVAIDLMDDWGIEPVHVRITAGGYMIEFRYKILDVEKALILSDRKEFPYLLSMKSRAKLSVPYGSTVGFLKSNRRFNKKGKNYIAMFSNEGQHMLKGDKVKVQIKNQVSTELVLQ
jgi:hypothetical protein